MPYEIRTGRVKGAKKKGTFGSGVKPFKGKAKNRRGSKKQSVLVHKVDDSRLKEKAVKEPKYLKFFHEVLKPPCFVCGSFLGIEFHHVKEHSTDERIDSIGMALCYEHHHGLELSPHGTPVKFKKVYPMDVQFKNAARMYSFYKDGM